MSRKLIVAVHEFTDTQRAAIADAAARHGFEAAFFKSPADALPAAKDAEIILAASPDLLAAAPGLRWFCTPTAGVDHITARWDEASPGATLSNSSGAYGVTIAEHVLMQTLELLRRQREVGAIVANRGWYRFLPIRAIHGSRVTLLGTGDIGQEVLRRLRGFGPAKITGVNRIGANPGGLFDAVVPVERLCEALPETDIAILSLPRTPQTERLLNRDTLALLPDGAIIVNVGRGSCIDEAALEAELRAGRLSASLDVFRQEPLPAESTLWDCPNLLITPHISGNMALPYTVQRIAELFLEDFERYCAGEPLAKRVDPARGY